MFYKTEVCVLMCVYSGVSNMEMFEKPGISEPENCTCYTESRHNKTSCSMIMGVLEET